VQATQEAISKSKIFISTSGVKSQRIGDAVRTLANAGFTKIELSGGTNFYLDWYDDLKVLKKEFNLSYRLHNYFPPPEEHFVLNLASSDPRHLELSRLMIQEAIRFSSELGSTMYGFHAGFLVDAKVSELGNNINVRSQVDREKAVNQFIENYSALSLEAEKVGVSVYVENNVLSERNFISFGGQNLLMLCDSDEYSSLNQQTRLNLLLDIAHLKVSAQTLGKSFREEAARLWSESSYLHISDNDGTRDSNEPVGLNSEMYRVIKEFGLKDKEVTLEIYGSLEGMQKTFENMLEIL
jgi:sugar phosphate isomerase/epimerase